MSTDTTPETETPITPEAEPTPQAAPGTEQRSEQALLEQVRGDMERFKELALRSAADLENYRKRASREKEDAVRFANGNFLERLIPILDNFELGLHAAKSDSGAAAIIAGLEMVARQLQDFLISSGVEPVNAEPGVPFDPNVHEAIGQEEHEEIPDGAILRHLRKGYKLRERLIRPAMVMVSKGAPAAS